jgi:hypothetical protein
MAAASCSGVSRDERRSALSGGALRRDRSHPARAPQARVESLIGAASKRARFLPGLRCDGIGEAAQAWLTWPIGMPGSDGKAPEAIAVAMVAWLLLGAVAYAAQRAGSGWPSGHAPPPGASRAVAR